MNVVLDYVPFERIQEFEFCFVLTEHAEIPKIQLLVVDHKEQRVRQLDVIYTLEDAFTAAQNFIQHGFFQGGLLFSGIPDYSFSEQMKVSCGHF